MLHDVVMSRSRRPAPGEAPAAGASEACADRRRSDRVPFPAEIVLVWNHDFQTTMRYRVIDAGDSGYRIHSSLPLQDGMTGMVLRLLPGRGESMDQPVMVVWNGPAPDQGFVVGLRCF